jgi:hypothetical protein
MRITPPSCLAWSRWKVSLRPETNSKTAHSKRNWIAYARWRRADLSDGVVAMEAGSMSVWPAIAGGLSAVAVYCAGAAFLERRRIRRRSAALKLRLLK